MIDNLSENGEDCTITLLRDKEKAELPQYEEATAEENKDDKK